MKRGIILSAAATAFAADIYCFWQVFSFSTGSGYVFAGMFVFLVLGAFLAGWGFSSNIHNITSGEVIGHETIPESTAPMMIIPGQPAIGNMPATPPQIIPARYNPKRYRLRLRDTRGRTGWVDVTPQAYNRYFRGGRTYYGR